MGRLNKLASIRNEIAHGHVSETNMVEERDGVRITVASENYLMPSLNEGGFHERAFRFHHTAETIFAFQEEVRDHRWAIHTAYTSAVMREQAEDQAAGPELWIQRRTIAEMVARKIKASDLAGYLRPMADWPRE